MIVFWFGHIVKFLSSHSITFLLSFNLSPAPLFLSFLPSSFCVGTSEVSQAASPHGVCALHPQDTHLARVRINNPCTLPSRIPHLAAPFASPRTAGERRLRGESSWEWECSQPQECERETMLAIVPRSARSLAKRLCPGNLRRKAGPSFRGG